METWHCHCGERKWDLTVGKKWLCPVVQVRMEDLYGVS